MTEAGHEKEELDYKIILGGSVSSRPLLSVGYDVFISKVTDLSSTATANVGMCF